MKRPLEGLRILDFTRVYSGPYATLLLSDMGAEVIKVEHPRYGDDSRAFGPFIGGTSGYFETVNRGKKSIAIDYRLPEGQTLLRQLMSHFDVVIENFRPGQMARYGLDYETLKVEYPRLIYVSISGFGQTGFAAGCYDVVAQAMSGLMSLTGLPELPIKTGPAIADAITGLTAAVGLLGALWGRERSGQGVYVDVSMVDSVFACLENSLADYSVHGQARNRQGNIDSALAPFDSFQACDGWIVIGVGNDRLWRVLAEQINPDLSLDARFATNEGRLANYHILRPILDRWCRQQPMEDLLACLHKAGIPSGMIRSMEELACDPQLEARGMLARLELGDSHTLLVPGSPIHMKDVEPTQITRGPHLGEHTRTVLLQTGVTPDEIDQLMASQVIVC